MIEERKDRKKMVRTGFKRNIAGQRFISTFLTIIIVLLAISSFSFAQTKSGACGIATKFYEKDGQFSWTSWGVLSIIAISISFLLTAITFMSGKILEKVEIINRAKTDIQQAIATIIILILFMSFVNIICSIDASSFGFGSGTLFDQAKKYFDYAESVVKRAYVKSIVAIMQIASLSSIQVFGYNPIGLFMSIDIFVSPFTGLGFSIGTLQFFMNLAMTNIVIISAHKFVLKTIELYFLNLLPIGIVLRAFSPTRELGGIFIALSIGLFVFYPLLFSAAYFIMGLPQPVEVGGVGEWYDKIIVWATTLGVGGILPWVLVGIILGMMFGVEDVATTKIFDMFSAIGNTIVPVFIFPALIWIIVGLIIRDLSRAMGEEIDVTTLARMI